MDTFKMPEKWGYLGIGVSSVIAMLGLQRFIYKAQNKKVDDACSNMKEGLLLKQDKTNCGLMSKNLEDKIDGIVHSVDKLTDAQNKLAIEVAVLNNGRKRVVNV